MAGGFDVRRALRLPLFGRGQRIGLFGGTFDPPHQAHRTVCLIAMRRLGLDCVWWLVTPGNPLKDTSGLAPLADRLVKANALARHPRIAISGIEATIGAHYTYDILKHLRMRCPGVRFVWIMGADNLRSFHRWQKWQRIAALMPMAVVDRLGPSLYATAGPAGHALGRARIREHDARSLAGRKSPAWVYLHGLKSPLSSTALRAARSGRRGALAAESH
jgi:nicotinate-nucleotide adenylyltransferase